MTLGIQSAILKTDKIFSIIALGRTKYNKCRVLVVYNFNNHNFYQINFYNKDNLNVSSCFINERNKMEKVVEPCLNCINYNKAISMHHIAKLIS